MNPEPIAVMCSDIHLSVSAPVARSAEKDWDAVMARNLAQIRKLQKRYGIPVFFGGDLFDKWNSPAELINFALRELPDQFYAIPGQHDLPFHRFEDVSRSAFGTLLEAGRIKLLSSTEPLQIKNAKVWGFPWGIPIVPQKRSREGKLHVCVAHAHIWKKGASYPGAPEKYQISAYKENLRGYDVALFGDNHKGFLSRVGDCSVYNNGGFIRRRVDEVNYSPHIALLMSDGSVDRVYLNTEADKFMDTAFLVELAQQPGFTMEVLMKELSELGGNVLDFTDNLKKYLDAYEVSPGACKLCLKSISHE